MLNEDLFQECYHCKHRWQDVWTSFFNEGRYHTSCLQVARIHMEMNLVRWVEEALGGFHYMELSVGNVNSWVESFIEAAVTLQQKEKTREEGGESMEEDINEEEDRSCMVSTWRCLSSVLEQAVRHSCRPAGLTR